MSDSSEMIEKLRRRGDSGAISSASVSKEEEETSAARS